MSVYRKISFFTTYNHFKCSNETISILYEFFVRFICFVFITFCPHRSKYVESKSSNPKYSENFELIASAFIWSAILLNVHFPFESCLINQYAGPPTNQVFKDSEQSFYKATNSIPYSYIKFMTNFKGNFSMWGKMHLSNDYMCQEHAT